MTSVVFTKDLRRNRMRKMNGSVVAEFAGSEPAVKRKKTRFGFVLLCLLIIAIFVSCNNSPEGSNAGNFEDIGLSTRYGRKLYKVSPFKEHGYNIAAYLTIPDEIRAEHLLVVPYKSGDISDYETKDGKVRDIVVNDSGRYSTVAEDTGSVTLFLVIPELSNDFRHLELDPWTLFSDDEFSHLDEQVCSLIDDVLAFLEHSGIKLEDKVSMAGYSGEGNFIVRFALLHPARLWIACAGGVSWAPSIALTALEEETLEYPLGIADIEKYTDDFSIGDWKEIRFLIDMGLLDDRGSYNRQQLETMDWAKEYVQDENYKPVWDVFCTAFSEISPNAELVTYTNMGHEHNFSRNIDFIRANDKTGSPFTFITPLEECDILVSGWNEPLHVDGI